MREIGFQVGWIGTAADLSLLNDLPGLKWLLFDLKEVDAEAVGGLKLTQPVEVLILANASDEHLARLAHLPRCGSLDLILQTLSPEGCRRLAELAEGIEILTIEANPKSMIDDGLKYIGQIRSLKRLELSGTSITDEGLSQLATLDKLEDLQLANLTRIRGPGYASLMPIKTLRHLSIYGTPIDADGFKALATLTQLEALILQFYDFPAPGLKPADITVLKGLSNLRSLEIASMAGEGGEKQIAFGDGILTAAGAMPSLRRLTIRGIGTGPDGLEALAKAINLKELILNPSQ